MDSISAQVYQHLKNAGIAKADTPVVIAVSGGVDSMVLLHIISRLSDQKEFQQVRWYVAHFNHHLRPTSDRDMTLVKDFADSIGFPYFIGHWDQPASQNIEALAREARYEFFAEVAQAVEATTICLAHHLNDQAETLLMRLVRGTSLKGWHGMSENYIRLFKMKENQAINLKVLRPLLHQEKESIYQYASDYQVPFAEDETNHTNDYLRNRIRHQVIPLLVQENSRFLSHVDQFIEDNQRFYSAHYENFLAIEPLLAMPNDQGGWTLMLDEWWQLSQTTRKVYLGIFFDERVVHKFKAYSQAMLKQVEKIIEKEAAPNSQIDMGDQWKVIREYEILHIIPNQEAQKIEDVAFPLWPINSWIQISETETIGLFEQDLVSIQVETGKTLVYHLNLAQQALDQFVVRRREDGDRMVLQTQEGEKFTKKISRIFIDNKVPSDIRKQAWLVLNQREEVVWLVGIMKGFHKEIEEETEITHSILYRNLKNS